MPSPTGKRKQARVPQRRSLKTAASPPPLTSKPVKEAARAAPPRKRAARAAPHDRRAAILQAALAVFSEHGFEAARLDEVAARAGIAKGTLYLHFEHKEALFEALVLDAIAPVVAGLEALVAHSDLPPRAMLASLFEVFEREILSTDRKLVIRLVLAEGPRFPRITAFYHREVISRAMPLLRTIAARGHAEGWLATESAVRFPHLLVAPMLLAVAWDALFARIEPLDVKGLIAAHIEQLAPHGRKPA